MNNTQALTEKDVGRAVTVAFPYAKRPVRGTISSWTKWHVWVMIGKTLSQCPPVLVEFCDEPE